MSDPSGKHTPEPVHLCGEEIPHAGHICAFFDSRSEKYEVIAPYLAEGIAKGDRILNVVDEKDRDEHVQSLSARNVPIRDAINRGQYQLLTAEETYLTQGARNLDGMLQLLREALESAQRDGTSIRTCGEMNWVARSSMPVEEVLSYEARVNEFVPSFQCTLVCVYDTATLPSGMVADILATHSAAIINGRLRSNPVHVAPNEFLEMLHQRKRMRRDAAPGSPGIDSP